jgi:hypothetical protein
LGQLDALSVYRIEVATILFRGHAIPVFVHAEARQPSARLAMNPRLKSLAELTEQFQEMQTVSVIAEDVLAFVPASGDMIPPPCSF